jgi:hypothetical protein
MNSRFGFPADRALGFENGLLREIDHIRKFP